MQVKVYAKLNLTLGVGARQGSFHPIDSVATSVDVSDVVEVVPRNDFEVCVSGVAGVEQEHNTAYKAARAFQSAFSTRGVDIQIRKGIPFGGGLGGSSADAAAVLFCMRELYKDDLGWENSPQLREKLMTICSELGSDVTFMLRGGLGRLRGKGDDVEYFRLQRPLYFALTTFSQQMSSREVYASFDHVCGKDAYRALEQDANGKLLTELCCGNVSRALSHLCNDLQPATRAISSYADAYLQFTGANGLHSVMTGSGSAYFVAFETRAEAQRAVDLLNLHGFSTTLCQTVPCGIDLD